MRRLRQRCASWALWQQPKGLIVLVLIINVLAITVSFTTALISPIALEDLVRFAVLATCAWVSIEMTRHIERKREYWRSSTAGYIDTKSIWSFAAVIVLPPALASTMVVLTYTLAWARIRPHRRPGLLHRWTFSCATVLLGTQAAVAVLSLGMHDYPGAPASAGLDGFFDLGLIALAGLLRWGINLGLVMVAIALSSPSARVRDLFANFSEQVLEAGALGLGMATAAVVVTSPFVLPGIVIAMVALHRGLLVQQYEHASRTDAKTGLATAGRWHEFAEQTLTRARDVGGTMGLLIVDLDHFKAINDTYGHPFGDDVLQEVANELLAEVRDQDACGRWGGEEFAIVLPDVGDTRNLHHVAERVRRRIQTIVIEVPGGNLPGEPATVNPTASVGAAFYPSESISTLDELLLAADTALYDAKNSGRNTVRLSAAVPLQIPTQTKQVDAID